MKIKFDVMELPDKPTDKIVRRTEEREYQDEAIRDNELCTVCGFPDYPTCQKRCQSYGFLKEQEANKDI